MIICFRPCDLVPGSKPAALFGNLHRLRMGTFGFVALKSTSHCLASCRAGSVSGHSRLQHTKQIAIVIRPQRQAYRTQREILGGSLLWAEHTVKESRVTREQHPITARGHIAIAIGMKISVMQPKMPGNRM